MQTHATHEHASGRAGLLTGLFWGAAAGTVLGLMLAPKSGRELRRDMSQSADRLRHQALETYNDASVAVGEAVQRSRRAFDAGREAYRAAAHRDEAASLSVAPIV